MIVKCVDKYGVQNCSYRPFCLASLNDRSITGCNLPLVWAGIIPKSEAIVEHKVIEGRPKW